VKLRGFRIELGEIESRLQGHAQVQEAVVLAREDAPGDKRLVAYVVGVSGEPPSGSELRRYLQGVLPEYMVPSAFVGLERFPLSPNGKVDRRALPAPEGERQVAEAYVAPRSDLEHRIAEIWRAVLQLEEVGVRDNFFDLGGHSLRLVQVQGRLEEALGRPVAVVELFQHPTIERLARHLGGEGESRSLAAEARARVSRRGSTSEGAIAIVGLSGRFPGAGDVESFWENLCAGVESITFSSEAGCWRGRTCSTRASSATRRGRRS
jgi:polyketide synthase PksJ